MYTLIRSFVYSSMSNYQYKEEDISTISINYIYALYDDVVIEVSSVLDTELKFVSLSLLKYKFVNKNLTIQQVLDSYTDLPLEGVVTFNPNAKHVSYSDALQAGYKVVTCKIGIHPTNPIPAESATDLLLLRPAYDTDVVSLNKYALITVNGYLHRTVTDEEYLYVDKGAVSLHRSNNNNLGIISFREMCSLKTIPITEQMLYKQDSELSYYKKTYINLNEDISNKTVLLSVGGYLYTPSDSSFLVVSDTSVGINLEASNYLEKLTESSTILNLDTIVPSEFRDSKVLSIPDVTSDEKIINYLTLPQSFIIILDSTDIKFNKIKIESNNLPNIITTTREPIYPLVTGYGRLSEYWKVKEHDQWTLNIMNNQTANYNLSYLTSDTVKIINDSQLPRDKFRQNKKHFLEILKP